MTTRSIPHSLEIVHPPRRRANFWLWPNLLTLQAPLVAVLWQCLLAQSLHAKLNPFAPWALAMAVWLIYVADHLLDTARPRATPNDPPRKEFCRKHWEKFLLAAVVVGCVLAAGVIRFLWEITVRIGWKISASVVLYFALIHFTPAHWRKNWPREVVVAVIFSLGTFSAVWFAAAEQSAPIWAAAILFMALCCTNCSLIETWEWEVRLTSADETPNRVARWVSRHLPQLGILIALISAILSRAELLPSPFAVASTMSGLGLALLSQSRNKLPIRFVSPLADLTLCSPLLILLWSSLSLR